MESFGVIADAMTVLPFDGEAVLLGVSGYDGCVTATFESKFFTTSGVEQNIIRLV